MNIHIIAYPHGAIRKNFTIELIYLNKGSDCSLFSKDGTYTVPEVKTYIKNIPLDSGFTFSGFIFEEPVVNEEKEEVFIHVTDILISRDGVLHPEIAPNDVANLLTRKQMMMAS